MEAVVPDDERARKLLAPCSRVTRVTVITDVAGAAGQLSAPEVGEKDSSARYGQPGGVV